MEISLYVFASIGVLALIASIVAFVIFLNDMSSKITGLESYVKHLDRQVDNAFDRHHSLADTVEGLGDELEVVTDIVAADIAQLLPKKRSARKK